MPIMGEFTQKYIVASTLAKWMDDWRERASGVIPDEDIFITYSHLLKFSIWNGQADVDSARLQEYLDWLSLKGKTHSGSDAIKALHWLFCRLGNKSPALRLKFSFSHKPRIKVSINEAQFRKVQKTFSKNYTRDERNLLVLILWYTGMAYVDASHLKWSDIDFDSCIITGSRSKTSSRFRVPFEKNGELHKALLEISEPHLRTGYVSDRNKCDYYASGPARSCASADLRLSCQLAGMPKGSGAHSFRRSFITRLAKSGVPELTIAEMTGHMHTSQLKVYYKPENDDLAKALATIPTRPLKPSDVQTARENIRKRPCSPNIKRAVKAVRPADADDNVAVDAGVVGKNPSGDDASV